LAAELEMKIPPNLLFPVTNTWDESKPIGAGIGLCTGRQIQPDPEQAGSLNSRRPIACSLILIAAGIV